MLAKYVNYQRCHYSNLNGDNDYRLVIVADEKILHNCTLEIQSENISFYLVFLDL